MKIAHGAAELDDLFADTDRSQQTRQQPRLVAGDRRRLIDAGGAIHAAELTWRMLGGLEAPRKT